MYFFLIVGGGMAVAIFLIYQLCRLAHIEVKLSSLVLCAVLALVVNVIAVKMSPFLDRGHYIRLGLLVVAAAAVVTVFNERLLRREEALAAGTKEAVLSAIKKPLPWEGAGEETAEELSVEEDAAAGEELAGAAEPATAADAPIAAAEAAELDAPAAPAAESGEPGKKPALEVRPTESEVHAYASEQVTVRARGKETAEIVATEKLEEAQEKTQALAAELEAREEAIREENLARLAAEREAAAAAAREEKLAAEQAEREARMAAETAERERYRAEVAELATLDDILDYIYEVKAVSPLAAIVAYGDAITRFADDSYTPFLIIELSTLYREQGDYAGAIRTYEHALTLPIIAENSAMQLEMTKNLSYLRTVSDILTAHQAQSTPFAAIPADIKQEIETEFEQRLANTMGE